MKKIIFLAMSILNLMGCNPTQEISNKPELEICTLIGSFYTIKVDVKSVNPLPPNLGVAFNGKTVDVDECNPKDPPLTAVTFNGDRTRATIYYTLHFDSEDFRFYFSREQMEPITNAIDLIFFSREKCSNPPLKFQETSDNNGISWEPVYANGKHCGVDSYQGNYQVDL